MILCDRHHKVSPNPNPWQSSNGFALHEEWDTLWHFVMSIVKYRESHYVTVLDMYDNFDGRAVCSSLLFQVPIKLNREFFANSLVTLQVTKSFAALNSFL